MIFYKEKALNLKMAKSFFFIRVILPQNHIPLRGVVVHSPALKL